jgi:GntP family gluconate:H+ symporter
MPQADNLIRVNRMLIEDAFADELQPATGMNPALYSWGVFWGNRNIALLLGAVIALFVLVRQKKGLTLARIAEMIEPPFATAGVIILITSAGGAFGLMLKNAGVGDAVKALVGDNVSGAYLLLLSWLVAGVIRIAQGSATVAMLTTAAMIYPIMSGGAALPYHPVYIFMAIGFGAMICSWMNDSGFWVVGKLSGFTEKETLKTWTVALTVNSVAGLLVCLVFSKLVPLI